MPYNLLLLPLVAGYYLLTNFVYFKFKYQRLPAQRLLFSSIIAGIFIATSSFAIQIAFKKIFPTLYSFLESKLKGLSIHFLESEYSWTLIFGFFGTLILVLMVNYVVKKLIGELSPINYAVSQYGDELEQVFRDSVIFGWPLQISLKNDKVYIGFVDEIPEPKKTNYLKFLPLYSGFRDNHKMLVLTTSYETVYDMLHLEGLENKTEMMAIILKQDEIISASPHDPEVYSRFIESEQTKA